MLQLKPADTFEAAVKLTVPGKAGALVRFEFVHLTRRELSAWLANAEGLDDAGFLLKVVRRWVGGVLDPKGAEVPFTPEAFGQLLDAYVGSAIEIRDGYLAAYHEAAAGN